MTDDEPGRLARLVPIAWWLPRYERSWLAADALAGLSVWALLVPQSLAYATVAGVPVQYGLYTAFVALVAYAVFGTSRQLITGPSATVGAVSAAIVAPVIGAAAMGTDVAAAYAAGLALATATVYLLLGALRMGWISNFLSRAVMAGFVLGFAIGIIINQTPKLLGLPDMPGSYVQQLWETLTDLTDTDVTTLAVGAASLAALLVMRAIVPRWPRALVVMTAAIAPANALDLAGHGVVVTGHIPTGLFSIGLPGVEWARVGTLLVGALSVVFVGYSESLAAGRRMAIKHRYELDQDQELIAQGVANAAAGLVGGFVVDGSLTKTAAADVAGQRTQMASLLNAALVLLTMLVLASLFEDLPSATLGAVVIDAMVGLVTIRDLRRYHTVNQADWLFFMGAMIGILTFGIMIGILTGVVLSLLLLIARSSRPTVPRLGRDPTSHEYHDVARIAGLVVTAGVLITRIDGPLFFADADRFRTRMRQMAAAEPGLRAVIVDASAVYLTDTDGADMLIQVANEMRRDGTALVLAHVHPGTLGLWRRAGVIDAIGEDQVFETVGDAEQAWTERQAEP